MSDKVLYFIGAGASRAVWARMPLMNDFLQLGFEYAQASGSKPEEVLPYWAMMGHLEVVHDECGVWGGSRPPSGGLYGGAVAPEFEVSGGETYRVLARHIRAGNESPEFRTATDKYLGKLNESRSPRSRNRRRTNIEWALSQAEEYALRKDDDAPFLAIKNFILWLLGKLEAEAGAVNRKTPFDYLCDSIQQQGYSRITRFVSFNYDVLLERALERKNPNARNRGSGTVVWNPHENYGVGFQRYLSYADLEAGKPLEPRPFRHKDKGHVTVLKPHGSLYWFRQRHGDRWDAPLLDLANPTLPALPPRGNSFSKLIDEYLRKPEDGFEPILIPPSPTKAMEGTVFWETWQGIDRELQGCESVVVIGWNMPATDTDVRSRISEALAKRNQPIRRLLVCDLRKSDIFYHRFVASFRPHIRVEPWREGFSEAFVRECLVPRIMSPQR